MAVLLMDHLSQMAGEFKTAMNEPRKAYKKKGITINATEEELKLFLSWAADSADYLSKLVSGEYVFPNSSTDLDNTVWCQTLNYIHDGVENIRVGKAIINGEPFRGVDMNGEEKEYGSSDESDKGMVVVPSFARTRKEAKKAKAKTEETKAKAVETKAKAEETKAKAEAIKAKTEETKAEETKAEAMDAIARAEAEDAKAKAEGKSSLLQMLLDEFAKFDQDDD